MLTSLRDQACPEKPNTKEAHQGAQVKVKKQDPRYGNRSYGPEGGSKQHDENHEEMKGIQHRDGRGSATMATRPTKSTKHSKPENLSPFYMSQTAINNYNIYKTTLSNYLTPWTLGR